MPASCLPQGRWPGSGTPGFPAEDSRGLDGTVIHSHFTQSLPLQSPDPRPPPAGSVHISRSQGLNLGPATVREAQVFLPLPPWGRGPDCAKPQAEIWGEGRKSTGFLQCQQPQHPSGVHGPREVGSAGMGVGGGTEEQSDSCLDC